MQLKDLQKYRYTLTIFAILGIIIIILIILTSKNPSPSPLAPSIKPPTAAFSTNDPETLSIPWEKIRVNGSKDSIDAILGKPTKIDKVNGVDQALYQSTTPYQFHIVEYKDNKAIQITRFVNERKEKVTPESFRQKYGKPEILKKGEGIEYQVETYKVSNNEFIIITLDLQYNTIYEIVNATKEKYEQFKSNLAETPKEEYEHVDLEGY